MKASSADARRIVTSAMREVNHARAATARRWAPRAGQRRLARWPRGPAWTASDVDAEPAARASPLTARTHPAQALDQHGVGLERLGAVEKGVEHLVVPRGAHVEELLDGLLLRAGVLPPLSLERQDLEVARAEAVRGLVAVRLRRGVVCAHVPVSLRSCVGSVHTLDRNDKGVIQSGVSAACRAWTSLARWNCSPIRLDGPCVTWPGPASRHRIEDGVDVLTGGLRVADGEPRQRLPSEARRHDERELLGEQPVGPRLVVLG